MPILRTLFHRSVLCESFSSTQKRPRDCLLCRFRRVRDLVHHESPSLSALVPVLVLPLLGCAPSLPLLHATGLAQERETRTGGCPLDCRRGGATVRSRCPGGSRRHGPPEVPARYGDAPPDAQSLGVHGKRR